MILKKILLFNILGSNLLDVTGSSIFNPVDAINDCEKRIDNVKSSLQKNNNSAVLYTKK